MSSLTTHVLDVSSGRPARGIAVVVERKASGRWKVLGRGKTNSDGRVLGLLKPGPLAKGFYRLTFRVSDYFKGGKCFYPEIVVVFKVEDLRHHHVPLLLSPFGYSTYRGS